MGGQFDPSESYDAHLHVLVLDFYPDRVSSQLPGPDERGARAEEWVEDEVAFGGGGEEDAFEEGERFLGGMLAEFFFPGFGRRDGPDGLHLFAAGELFHGFVVKGVARLFVFGGPDDGFGGVGEIAAGKIGRRVGLDPGDVVQELEFELLHGEADGMDDVAGAGDPDGAVGLQEALAGGEPFEIEFVIGLGAAGAVPFAFVDADHASGVAGDAVVGEEVGRVGEDEVDGFSGEFFEDFEGVALKDFDVMARVVKDGSGQGVSSRVGRGAGVRCGRGFGHDGGAAEGNGELPADQLGSLIKWVTESSGGIGHGGRRHGD